ncbi:uncharacterized protein UTRI_01316_B [Ustilago trichophora]|uniref:BTB domain-containing protein n=1 Tax=Ustilago trichophora TaxID=86804 RepID=A0A5C3DTP3_9BASI|nr:uncharacterized protein UTRI_01316_B [Ustilago trichophora]
MTYVGNVIEGWEDEASAIKCTLSKQEKGVVVSVSEGSDADDVDMDSVTESESLESDTVVLVGLDHSKVECSIEDIFHRSGKLWEMAQAEGGRANPRIYLPLIWQEVKILSDSLNLQTLPLSYWDPADLKELVKAVELHIDYEFYDWDVAGLEHAILDRLRDGPDTEEQVSRFYAADSLYLGKLCYIAEKAGMDRLVRYIDREADRDVARNEPSEGRPRKWQKISERIARATY